MDKNGKLFGKISIIDLFVLILIMGVCAGTVYRFGSKDTAVDKGTATIHYTLRVNGVRDFTFDSYLKGVEEGLPCYDKKTSQFIGKIVGARQEPFFENSEALDGSMVYAEKPGVIAVYVDIEAEGSVTDDAYFAEGTYEIKVGSKVNLNFKYIDVEAAVFDVSAQ